MLDRLARAVERYWQADPMYPAFVAAFFGVIAAILAVLLNVDFVKYYISDCAAQDATLLKEVGYFPALNWSLSLVVLFPAALFFAHETLGDVRPVIMDARNRGMFVNGDWSQPDDPAVDRFVRSIWLRGAVFGGILFAVGIVITVADFIDVVGPELAKRVPYVCGGQTAQPDLEFDWSVSALFTNIAPPGAKLASIDANLAFSGYVYVVLGVLLGLVLCFYGFVLSFMIAMRKLKDPAGTGFAFVADPRSTDPRKGFEIFDRFTTNLLITTFIGYVLCFLMRIQNIFLHDDAFTGIFQMLFGKLAESFKGLAHVSASADLFEQVKEIAGNLGEAGLSFISALTSSAVFKTPQALYGSLALLIFFSLVAGFVSVVLRGTASSAKRRMLDGVDAAAPAAGLAAAEIRTSLDDMEIWPLSWGNLPYFLKILTFAFVCFFFYRLGIVWIVYQIRELIKGRLWQTGGR